MSFTLWSRVSRKQVLRIVSASSRSSTVWVPTAFVDKLIRQLEAHLADTIKRNSSMETRRLRVGKRGRQILITKLRAASGKAFPVRNWVA
jgi:hypothetical protein